MDVGGGLGPPAEMTLHLPSGVFTFRSTLTDTGGVAGVGHV